MPEHEVAEHETSEPEASEPGTPENAAPEREARVHGHCDERFAAVREAFEENFRERGELGAAVTVIVGGRTVVDLWGGWADAARSRPWERDTLVNVWSTTKGPVALCAHVLVDRGLLDLDAPVAAYWPEFAAAGKEKVLVRHLLSHRAGLAGLREPHSLCDTGGREVRLRQMRARVGEDALEQRLGQRGPGVGVHAGGRGEQRAHEFHGGRAEGGGARVAGEGVGVGLEAADVRADQVVQRTGPQPFGAPADDVRRHAEGVVRHLERLCAAAAGPGEVVGNRQVVEHQLAGRHPFLPARLTEPARAADLEGQGDHRRAFEAQVAGAPADGPAGRAAGEERQLAEVPPLHACERPLPALLHPDQRRHGCGEQGGPERLHPLVHR